MKKIFKNLSVVLVLVMILSLPVLAKNYYYEDEDGNAVLFDTKGNYLVIDEDGNYYGGDKRGNYYEGDEDGNIYYQDRKGNGYYYDADNNGVFEYYRYRDVPSQRYYSQGTIVSPGAGPGNAPGSITNQGSGWERIGKAWAYKERGVYVINAWRQINNKWYYFNGLGLK